VTTQGKATHIVMHYSATYADQDIGAAEIDKWHRDRGFAQIGYHWVIRRDGTVEAGRPESVTGAHVRGMNTGKIGVCVVGGLDRTTGPNVGVDNRTSAQIAAQIKLTREILARHPGAHVVGHRDLVATQCPAYDAAAWWASVQADHRTGTMRVVAEKPARVADQPLATKPVDVSEPAQGERQNWLAAIMALLARIFGGKS
jgi:N-acetyl-anhydromuramyl-L-alanine amidase AmpD